MVIVKVAEPFIGRDLLHPVYIGAVRIRLTRSLKGKEDMELWGEHWKSRQQELEEGTRSKYKA